jgi:hypothetical protein
MNPLESSSSITFRSATNGLPGPATCFASLQSRLKEPCRERDIKRRSAISDSMLKQPKEVQSKVIEVPEYVGQTKLELYHFMRTLNGLIRGPRGERTTGSLAEMLPPTVI